MICCSMIEGVGIMFMILGFIVLWIGGMMVGSCLVWNYLFLKEFDGWI